MECLCRSNKNKRLAPLLKTMFADIEGLVLGVFKVLYRRAFSRTTVLSISFDANRNTIASRSLTGN